MRKESGVLLCSKFILIVLSLVAPPCLLNPTLFILAFLFLNIIKLFPEMLNLLTFIFFCYFINMFHTWESIKWSFPKGRPSNWCLKSLNNTGVYCLWSPVLPEKNRCIFFPECLIVKGSFRTNFSTYKYCILCKILNKSYLQMSFRCICAKTRLYGAMLFQKVILGAKNLYIVNAWCGCIGQYFSPFWQWTVLALFIA